MYKDLPNRGCHMQTGPSPSPRVFRLWRQYISMQISPTSPTARQAKLRDRGVFRGSRTIHRGSPAEGTRPQRQDYRHITETACEQCGSGPHKFREECWTNNQEVTTVGDLDIFERCASKIQTIEASRLRSTT